MFSQFYSKNYKKVIFPKKHNKSAHPDIKPQKKSRGVPYNQPKAKKVCIFSNSCKTSKKQESGFSRVSLLGVATWDPSRGFKWRSGSRCMVLGLRDRVVKVGRSITPSLARGPYLALGVIVAGLESRRGRLRRQTVDSPVSFARFRQKTLFFIF